jgi:uncharacterized SAM-binding protein YcdF (DUF218 family)
VAAGALFVAALIWRRGQNDEGSGAVADLVVVLGAAHHDGRPSRVFAARLDHGIELVRRGAAPRLFVTGGRESPDRRAEAEVAQAYALERGIPVDAILAESTSRDTRESLRHVAAAMRSLGLRRAILVSDRTHMLRTLLIARDLGIHAVGSPTRTSPADLHWLPRTRALLHEVGALGARAAVRAVSPGHPGKLREGRGFLDHPLGESGFHPYTPHRTAEVLLGVLFATRRAGRGACGTCLRWMKW